MNILKNDQSDNQNCSMADGISFEVSLSLNCTDLYKRGGGA